MESLKIDVSSVLDTMCAGATGADYLGDRVAVPASARLTGFRTFPKAIRGIRGLGHRCFGRCRDLVPCVVPGAKGPEFRTGIESPNIKDGPAYDR